MLLGPREVVRGQGAGVQAAVDVAVEGEGRGAIPLGVRLQLLRAKKPAIRKARIQ